MISKLVTSLGILVLSACGPRDVVVGGIHVTDRECRKDLSYVEAHHSNEQAIKRFVRGMGDLPNKPMIMVYHSLTVCGRADDQALEEYMRAESESTSNMTSAQVQEIIQKRTRLEKAYEEQLAILKKRADV